MTSTLVTSKHGVNFWYNKEGQFHRLNGPAIAERNGDKNWFVNGRRHRIDGPAIVERNGGTKYWYVDDCIHRISGPARIWRHTKRYNKSIDFNWYINLSISYDPVMDNA